MPMLPRINIGHAKRLEYCTPDYSTSNAKRFFKSNKDRNARTVPLYLRIDKFLIKYKIILFIEVEIIPAFFEFGYENFLFFS